MDFEKFNNDIFDYFKTNLKNEIEKINIIKTDYALKEFDVYINDYYDPTIHTSSNVFCMEVIPNDTVNIVALTNESKLMTQDYLIQVIVKKDNKDNLKKAIYRYLEAIYNLFDFDNSLGGLVDIGFITEYQTYNTVLNSDAKGLQIKFQIQKEI